MRIVLIIISLLIITNLNGKIDTIKIDSDKVIEINNSKIFPVYIYSICNSNYEKDGIVAPCNPVDSNKFLFSAGGAEMLNYQALYEQAGVYYTLYGPQINDTSQNLIDSKYFFGYQQIDEPNDDDVITVSNIYDNIKARDPFHPVILNHWKNMVEWSQFTDIITWDIYPFNNVSSWSRQDSIYAYEQKSEESFFNGSDLNSINKPVWAVIQANGIPFDGLAVPTPKEARSLTYTAITMDVKGIGYWGYKSYGGPNDTSGLYKNPKLYTYYKQLAGELKSLNNILTLPTVDHSWYYHPGSMVKFKKTLTKTVLGKKQTNFNYILKRDGKVYYLIIVNKDSRSIKDVTINIRGLTDIKIKTLGLETEGSGRAGRIIKGTNGQFTDSFDGYDVHIYQILGIKP